MDTQNEKDLRNQLVKHLKGGQAYSSIDNLIEKIPFDKIGIVPNGLPYSFYQLFFHIRVAQEDILSYCRDEDYQTPDWPADYWPDEKAPANKQEWETLVQTYFDERQAFCDLLMTSDKKLMEPFTSNPDHNLLRQAELIIEHTSYHTGQLYVIYRLLND